MAGDAAADTEIVLAVVQAHKQRAREPPRTRAPGGRALAVENVAAPRDPRDGLACSRVPCPAGLRAGVCGREMERHGAEDDSRGEGCSGGGQKASRQAPGTGAVRRRMRRRRAARAARRGAEQAGRQGGRGRAGSEGGNRAVDASSGKR